MRLPGIALYAAATGSVIAVAAGTVGGRGGAVAAAGASPGAVEAVPASHPWFDVSKPRTERVDALLGAMTLDEKIDQLVVDTPAVQRLGVPAYHWRNNVLHGLVDNGRSTQFPQAIGMAATFDAEQLRLAARVMSDEQRAKHNTQNGAEPSAPGAAQDSRMNYGLDLWGPNLNQFWNPVWGRGQETYGEDPFLSAALTRAFVTGLQQDAAVGAPPSLNALGEPMFETGATCKHFLAYGIDREPPRLSVDENISSWQLEQYFYPAWEVCAEVAVSVMCAYNGVNGYPMCMSPLVNASLRDRFGFNSDHAGLTAQEGGGGGGRGASWGSAFGRGQYVVTDSGALSFMVSEFHRFPNTSEAAAAALPAGIDLNSGGVFGAPLKALFAANDTRVTEAMVDQALGRLFHARMSFGLFDQEAAAAKQAPWMAHFNSLGDAAVLSSAHRQVALATAQRSMLLLKNDGGLLPLSSTPPVRDGGGVIAVVGWGANDTYMQLGNYIGCEVDHNWGPVWANCSIVTPLDGIRAQFEPMGYTVRYARGCDVESNDTSGFAAATAAAQGADLVVFVGGNRNCEGGQGDGGAHCESEGHDRPDLAMPGVQTQLLQQLAAVNASNVVLALTTGGVVGMDWEAQNLPAILVAWYGGTEMGTALANILAGKVSPSARSPLTWFADMSQVPSSETAIDLTTPPGRTYRHFSGEPLYAFGFGLSFGKFNYSDARVVVASSTSGAVPTQISVCATVANIGSGAAATTEEVVQVYAVPPVGAAAVPPLRMLVGFTRTAALRAGQSADVCVPVETKSLALVPKADPSAPKQVLPGTYGLFIGGVAPGAMGRHVDPHAALPPQGPLAFTVPAATARIDAA